MSAFCSPGRKGEWAYSGVHLAAGFCQRTLFGNPAVVCVDGVAEVRVDLADMAELVQGEAVGVLLLQLFNDLDLAMAAADAGVQFDADELGVPDLAQAGNNLV